MSNPAQPDPKPDETRDDKGFERYKLRLGFWQAIWGTLISGGIAVAIPAAVDAYKARLDLQLKRAEIESKAQDFHQTYIATFLSTALNQDIELRLRFSEYFSFVSDDDAIEGWKDYHDQLERRRDEIRKSINTTEAASAQMRAISQPSVDQQIETARLNRELDWLNAEVGYARQNTNITVPAAPAPVASLDPNLVSSENERDFAAAKIDNRYLARIDGQVALIEANRLRYQAVEEATGVPWFIVALLHLQEANGNFNVNFVNGDPLKARTVNQPAGRPPTGTPPFSWEETAIDALTLAKLDQDATARFGSVGSILFEMERYNGFGYRKRGTRSPYVWSCTTLVGDLRSDRFWPVDKDGNALRCGVASILKRLQEKAIAQLPQSSQP